MEEEEREEGEDDAEEAEEEVEEDDADLVDAFAQAKIAGADADEEQIQKNLDCNKEYPLAHRALSQAEYGLIAQFESVLKLPLETTCIWQKSSGIGLSEGYRMAVALHNYQAIGKVDLVRGDGKTEDWKPIAANGLDLSVQRYRAIMKEQLDARFNITGTPPPEILLALMMDPTVDTSEKGCLLKGKHSMLNLMKTEYITALRKRLKHMHDTPTRPSPATPTRPSPAGKEVTTSPASKSKKSKGGGGTSIMQLMQQQFTPKPTAATSAVETDVDSEIKVFEKLCQGVLASEFKSQWHDDMGNFDQFGFYNDNRSTIPVHFNVFAGDVGCKKHSSANVETIFRRVPPPPAPCPALLTARRHVQWRW